MRLFPATAGRRRRTLNGMEVFTNWQTWQRAEPELRRLLPASTCDAVAAAVNFALTYHGDQKRPTGAPYAEHLLEAVEVLVRGAGVTDPDVLCAAVLHDVVEDTPCTIEDVRAAFGDRVAGMVAWVTKPETADGADRKASKEAYLSGSRGRAGRRDPRQAGRPGIQRADAAQPRAAEATGVLRADRPLHHATGRGAGMVGGMVRELAGGSSRSGIGGSSSCRRLTSFPARTASTQIASVAG